ncbi:MAG: hypothetical protein FH748_01440 [Balneolaceae bacterium]|nr:hypothetical protein [Balneolaceae bacterium]
MVKYFALLVVIGTSYIAWLNIPEKHGPGIVVEHTPEVTSTGWQKPFGFKNIDVIPEKKVKARVRIISKKRYFFDEKKTYSPIDVYVGWQQMSDEQNLKSINITLTDRNYDIEISRPPIPVKKVYNQSNLWHLVPSNKEIREKVTSIRTGNIIQVEGLLVSLKGENDFRWSTLKTIHAQPNERGAILWIEKISIE